MCASLITILDCGVASSTDDLVIPARAIESIQDACNFLRYSPFSCRKAGPSSFLRELIIRIYSPLFEIAAESSAELIHLAHFAGKLGYVIPPKAGFVNAHRGPPLRHIPPV